MTPEKRLIVDAEANGLLPMATQVWVVCVREVGTGRKKAFRNPEAFRAWLRGYRATEVITHNGLSYDLWLLLRLWDIPFSVKADGNDTWDGIPTRFTDTLHLSQFLNPDRGFHSVEGWSEFLHGTSRKILIEDWSVFSEDKVERCHSDCAIQEDIYHYLLKEAEERAT